LRHLLKISNQRLGTAAIFKLRTAFTTKISQEKN